MARLSLLLPFLFAVHPVLYLYSANMYIAPPGIVWSPILIIVIFALLVMLATNLIFKNIIKASLFTSVFLILFFMFGDVYLLLARLVLFSPYWLAAILLAILVLYFVFLKKLPQDEDHRPRLVLFIVAGCLLISFSIFNMVSFNLTKDMQVAETSDPLNGSGLPADNDHPDIFYIIVDGYGRQDILNDLYDYDNSEFLASLEKRGFYVAGSSMSNYCQTTLSLASSLNMDYIDELILDLDRQSTDRRPLRTLVKDSKVRSILEGQGYYLTSFFTPYSPVDINDVENYQKRMLGLNEFSHFLVNKTVLPLFFRDLQFEFYRRDVLNVLETNFESLDQSRPNFVYAHIIPPHPPFVFDNEGKPLRLNRYFSFVDGSHWGRDKEKYIDGYTGQVEFINASLLKMVDRILAQSDQPIIVIQADHGPGSELDWDDADETNFSERLSILNAYYFYDRDYEQLYQEITPVNTFRVVFNQYFDSDFEIVEDKSYFSTWMAPYNFIKVD